MKKPDRKTFGVLFFSIFASVTGVGIVVPLLPVYAHDLGGSGLYIGLIFASFSLSRTFFLPYFGKYSDKKGRKPYIVTGLFAYTLISFAFILAPNVETLISIRFIQGIASAMIMPVTQAYIGDITVRDHEGVTMGFFNLSVFSGLSIGPFIGGVMKDSFGLDMAFATMGILSFAGFVASFAMLPPTWSEQVISQTKKSGSWVKLLKDRDIDGIFIFRLIYTACIGIIWGFLPVYADMEFSLSSSTIGLLVMTGVLTSGILQTPMGFLADRINKRLMIILGGAIISYSMFTYIQAENVAHLFLANIIFGTGGSIAMAPLMAIAVQKGSSHKAMGTVMSLITMAHSMGMTLGSIGAGILMDIMEMREIFSLGMYLMLAGLFLYYVLVFTGRTVSTQA